MAKEPPSETLEIDGVQVRITNPDKVYFAEAKITKLEIARYYLAIASGALQGIRGRPIVLKRFVNGAGAPPFYQKRAPESRPEWLKTVVLRFPSGRSAEELVVDGTAALLWIVNLGCMELHPHAVRATDLVHPDELRVDLDPGPGVSWPDVRAVAMVVKQLLDEVGLVGWIKTSGSRGMHINCRIEPRWTFDEVRRAALALAREVARRAPSIATAAWWKEERHGVFLDYNQNAKDRTTCSAYSIRPLPDARVSAPLAWDEVDACEPGDFTLKTMTSRYAALGDLHRNMDLEVGSLEKLFELADRDEAGGLGDAPWPPHYRKKVGEKPRVAPSRAKRDPSAATPATGRRQSQMPLLVIAQAKLKEDALAGLERWKQRHPQVAALLDVSDILVDSMRGRSSIWTRIRINLRNVPEELRPAQEPPDPDYDLASEWNGRAARAQKE